MAVPRFTLEMIDQTKTWSSLLPSMFSCILWMEWEVCRKRWSALLERNWGEARIEASQPQSCWFRHLVCHIFGYSVCGLYCEWSSGGKCHGSSLEWCYPQGGTEGQGWDWEPRVVGLQYRGKLVEGVHRPKIQSGIIEIWEWSCWFSQINFHETCNAFNSFVTAYFGKPMLTNAANSSLRTDPAFEFKKLACIPCQFWMEPLPAHFLTKCPASISCAEWALLIACYSRRGRCALDHKFWCLPPK